VYLCPYHGRRNTERVFPYTRATDLFIRPRPKVLTARYAVGILTTHSILCLNTVIKDFTLASVHRTAKRGPRTTAKWNSGLGEVMMRVVR
jgi:hypothetical protein